MRPELATQRDQRLSRATAVAIRRLHLPSTLTKFLIVGAFGFLINQFTLFLLYDSPVFWFLPAKDTLASLGLFNHPDIRLLLSSVVAVEVAIFFQFNAHERWTFRDRARKGWVLLRFLKFNLTSSVSPIIVVVTVNTLTPLFGISPYISNTIGIAAGVTWNWTWNTLVIWPRAEGLRAP
jgi:putative flippase GtrA